MKHVSHIVRIIVGILSALLNQKQQTTQPPKMMVPTMIQMLMRIHQRTTTERRMIQLVMVMIPEETRLSRETSEIEE